MKKKGIICIFTLLFFCAVFWGSYYFGRYRFANNQDMYYVRTLPTQPVDVEKEIIVSNVTEIIVESVNLNTTQSVQQKISTPMEYIGLNRTKLVEKLRDEIINMSVNDKISGLISNELITFTKNRVVIRKTYSDTSVPKEYYVKEKDGYLVVYLANGETLYDYTDILYDNLEYSVKKRVKEGIYFDSPQELYEFLQGYTS